MDDRAQAEEDEGGAQDAAEADAVQQEPGPAAEAPDERFLRLAAEFDNYKKRVARDISEAKELGKAELLRSMLHVVDEFDLMLAAAGKSADKDLAKGIGMLYANFTAVLKKSGLKEIETDGMFDPYRHEIMMVRDGGGKKEGTILDVVKKGYTLNDRLLRPASVIVSKRGDKDAKAAKEEKPQAEGNENHV